MVSTQTSPQNTSVSTLLLSEYFTEAELAATLGKAVRTLQRLNCVGLGPPRTWGHRRLSPEPLPRDGRQLPCSRHSRIVPCPPEGRAKVISEEPIGRMGKPEEIATRSFGCVRKRPASNSIAEK
jgi:hypothetical protein